MCPMDYAIPTTGVAFDPDLIRKYDCFGPRYTSYPTADRFADFGAGRLAEAIRNRPSASAALSLYVHIPFCNTICYYCACNKIVTKDHGRSAKYIRYLGKEVALLSALVGPRAPLKQLHWGGGTPTFLSAEEMSRLMEVLHEHFAFDPDAEQSIEIDPRKVTADGVELLARLGFNRMSLGVQDFDPEVQTAVNRIQSEAETRVVLDAARANGFGSINVDLIYGLPRQTVPGLLPHARPGHRGRPGPGRPVQLRPRPAPVQAAAADQRSRVADAGHQAFTARLGNRAPDRCRLCLYRHGPLRQARRRAGRGAAPGKAASQLPGLFDARRLRPARIRHFVDRQDGRDLQPERAHARRLLCPPRRRHAAVLPRLAAVRRRPAAARGDPGADVPFQRRLRARSRPRTGSLSPNISPTRSRNWPRSPTTGWSTSPPMRSP